jgi:hypothetical protein
MVRHTLGWTSFAGYKDAWRIWRHRSLLTRAVGFTKATREDGLRYLPQPDELLRDDSQRSYPQSLFEVCPHKQFFG